MKFFVVRWRRRLCLNEENNNYSARNHLECGYEWSPNNFYTRISITVWPRTHTQENCPNNLKLGATVSDLPAIIINIDLNIMKTAINPQQWCLYVHAMASFFLLPNCILNSLKFTMNSTVSTENRLHCIKIHVEWICCHCLCLYFFCSQQEWCFFQY